jgi:predicted neuraminidase
LLRRSEAGSKDRRDTLRNPRSAEAKTAAPSKRARSPARGSRRTPREAPDRAGRLTVHPAFLLILPLLALLIVMSAPRDPLPSRVEPLPKAAAKLMSEGDLLHRGPIVATPFVDGLSVVALPGGRLLAAWFGGSSEHANDLSIATAQFDGRQWSVPRTVLAPGDPVSGSRPWIRGLRDVSMHVDRAGFVHLFVSSPVVPGSNIAAIEHFRSADGGQRFEHHQALALSPFLNLSHAVRAPAVVLKGGGFLLPIHFDFGAKYGVLLRFDSAGRLLHRERMDGPPHLLQPWAVAHDERLVEFFLRDASIDDPRVWLARLDRSEPTRALLIKNPNASLAAIPSFDGAIWLVRNPQGKSRETLVLQRLNALQQPTETLVLEKGRDVEVFSNPVLVQTDDGRIHVLYTDRFKRFAHRVFRATGL